jgi:uncharacterized damage-inducible protein DinB
VDLRELDRDVAGCANSHQRLLESLDSLTDEQARQPSNLPEWSVGHVLTHIARNADSHVRMLQGAERGHDGDVDAVREGLQWGRRHEVGREDTSAWTVGRT